VEKMLRMPSPARKSIGGGPCLPTVLDVGSQNALRVSEGSSIEPFLHGSNV